MGPSDRPLDNSVPNGLMRGRTLDCSKFNSISCRVFVSETLSYGVSTPPGSSRSNNEVACLSGRKVVFGDFDGGGGVGGDSVVDIFDISTYATMKEVCYRKKYILL